jgi:4-amino-4-deoxy-L-arabinose transferase-like glycosyltransferase
VVPLLREAGVAAAAAGVVSPPGLGRREAALALSVVLLLAAALRLPRLSEIPAGVIPDEALAAYDAWSISRTGRDAFGEWLPLFPRSSERWGSLYMYLAVPSVALLGLTPLAARLPSAFAGLATVLLVYRLVREEHGRLAGVLAAALLAVSPWHVLMSRTGFDWNLLPALATLTVLLTLRCLRGSSSSLWPGLAAAASFYSYAPLRLLVPLLLAGLLVLYWRDVLRRGRTLLPGAALALAGALPVLVSLTVGAASRLETIGDTDASGFARRYAAAFSPRFYLAGARGPELHRLRSTGLLHGFEVPLLAAGAVSVLLRRSPTGLFLLYWALAAPLAVSLHRDSPDPILLLTLLPVPQALGGIGAAWTLERSRGWGRARWALIAACLAWASWSVAAMARDLYVSYPADSGPAFGAGTGEAVREIETLRPRFTDVLVDGQGKHVYAAILFYSRYPPELRQRETASLGPRGHRARVGQYRIGALSELLATPGRHLVWTSREEGRRLFPKREALQVVRGPDGRALHALFDVESPGR